VLILGERHLRAVLIEYQAHYNLTCNMLGSPERERLPDLWACRS
jgi:hypothetical protein